MLYFNNQVTVSLPSRLYNSDVTSTFLLRPLVTYDIQSSLSAIRPGIWLLKPNCFHTSNHKLNNFVSSRYIKFVVSNLLLQIPYRFIFTKQYFD